VDLRQKYNYLELAYEALEDNLEQISKIESTKIVKIYASTSCDDLPYERVYTIIEKSATNPSIENASCSTKGKKEWTHIEMELIKEVESLKSSMTKLTRGEHKHKEMFFHHVRDFGKRGLVSYPVANKGKTKFPEIKTSFVKEVGFYCQHCKVTGHHTRECLLPTLPFSTLPKNSSLFKDKHFLLSKVKDKVKAKFIGKLTMEEKMSLPKQVWVSKGLVSRVLGPKLIWVPKAKP
jgi:hypothetical protein